MSLNRAYHKHFSKQISSSSSREVNSCRPSINKMECGQEEQAPVVEPEVKNKQILFRDFLTGYPKESNMVLSTGTIRLKLPSCEQGSDSKAILVKNLYLSCDPFMRHMMTPEGGGYAPPYTPGSVITPFPHFIFPYYILYIYIYGAFLYIHPSLFW